MDCLIAPESGGILLGHLVGASAGRPYVLVRKKRRPHMVAPLMTTVETIGTSGAQHLFLDDEDTRRIDGQRVAIIDEVISSGATRSALHALATMAGATVVQTLAVATEGPAPDPTVTCLVHLPLFPREP